MFHSDFCNLFIEFDEKKKEYFLEKEKVSQVAQRQYDENGNHIYYGMMKNGLFEGWGIAFDTNCNKEVECIWKKNEANGFGIEYYPSGQIRYEGEFKNGEFHGFGIMFNTNGQKIYEGQWDTENPHGLGISYRNDGIIEYEGYWKKGLYSGQGKLYVY